MTANWIWIRWKPRLLLNLFATLSSCIFNSFQWIDETIVSVWMDSPLIVYRYQMIYECVSRCFEFQLIFFFVNFSSLISLVWTRVSYMRWSKWFDLIKITKYTYLMKIRQLRLNSFCLKTIICITTTKIL